MVYRRKRTYKKRIPRKRGYAKKSGWGSTAMKALKIATRVASMINVEYKYIETDVTSAAISWNGSIYDGLCLPQQGVTVNQREGDSIKMKNLTIEGTLFRSSGNEIVRIIIFIDKDCSITTPATYWEGIGTNNVVLSDKNQDNKFKTKMLLDKTFIMTDDQPLKLFKWVVKIDKHLHFEKGSLFSATNNQLKMFVVNQNGNTTLSFHSHVSYVDN